MRNFVLLILLAIAGLILCCPGRTRGDRHKAVNAVIIRVALPAMILSQVHGIATEPAILFSVSLPLVLFLTGVATFVLIALALSLVPDLTTGLLLICGFANNSFLGLPMAAAFDRLNGRAAAVLTGQLGICLVLATLALTAVHVRASGAQALGVCAAGRSNLATMARRTARFPPFVALLAAVLLNGVSYPSWIAGPLATFGATAAPLALLSLGLRLRLSDLQDLKLPVALAISLDLIAGSSR